MRAWNSTVCPNLNIGTDGRKQDLSKVIRYIEARRILDSADVEEMSRGKEMI